MSGRISRRAQRLTSPIWIPTPSGCCSSCGAPTVSRWQTGSCHALRVDYNEWNRSGSEAEYAPQRLLRIMQAPAAETEAAAPVPMKPRKYTVPETLFPITVKKRDREAYVEKALRYVLEHDIEL